MITEQLEASIHGMVHDPNLSHRRGYLQIATRFIDYMSPEQAEEYRKARAQIEQEMDLTRTMMRARMGW